MAFTRPLEPFDVSVLRADHNTLWVSAVCRQGTIHAVPRPLPVWPAEVVDGRPGRWLTNSVRHALPEQATATTIGRALGDVIFGLPEIAALFEQTRGIAAGEGAQVLLRLMTAPHDVGAWPWELLVDPADRTRALTLARDTHLVRSARTRTYPVRSDPIDPPLNLLLVLSSPLRRGPADTEAVFDLYEEKRSLLEEVSPLVERGLLNVVIEDRPSVQRIRRRMSAERRGFHILHFLGHAQPAGLHLENRYGFGQLVPSDKFSELLQQLPDLRLAVFAGCETATAPDSTSETVWPGQLSITDYCVRDAAPAVVGMQAVLPFRTERVFTRSFYQGVTAGHSLSESLRLARLAIFDDDQTPTDLVDWAVPALFVSGASPGPLVDPTAKATKPPALRRAVQRVGVRQGDWRFFARQTELRTAIDVLSARSNVRLLVVSGQAGVGKSKLLDRAMDELGNEIAQVYVSADRLPLGDDGLEELCRLVTEVLKDAGERPRSRARRTVMQWWEALLEDLTTTPFALLVDDIDELSPDAPVIEALRLLVQRRGVARVGVSVSSGRSPLAAQLRSEQVRLVTLSPLSWQDTWQWIRRNLPVLVRRGEDALLPFFSDLGPQLEQWEQLARRLETSMGPTPQDEIGEIVAQLAGSPVTTTPQAPPVFEIGEADRLTADEPELGGPLKVAVAGQFTDGRTTEFARSITSMAAKHRVAGRAVDQTVADRSSSLAELLPAASPFTDGKTVTSAINRWLGDVTRAGADIVVLDYGSPTDTPSQRKMIEDLLASGRLVIAAGGNDGQPTYPAWLPGVIGVGALDGAEGGPATYSRYFPADAKPDLFAPGTLQNTVLAPAVSDPKAEGTTFSALYVAAAATLVWATYRALPADQVREILLGNDGLDPAAPAEGQPRLLHLDEALRRTRELILLDVLEAGRMTVGELLAGSGLPSEVALPILDQLVAVQQVRTRTDGSDRTYENPNAIYALYERLRSTTPAGPERTSKFESLVREARGLAERRNFDATDVARMWQSGEDGPRIVALTVMKEVPATRNAGYLVDAIGASRSAFEQHEALELAIDVVAGLAEAEAAALQQALEDQIGGSGYIKPDTNRWPLAQRLLADLAVRT